MWKQEIITRLYSLGEKKNMNDNWKKKYIIS